MIDEGAVAKIGERRHLVLLFTDLANSTGIARRIEPEQYAELLEAVRARLREAMARHGGEIASIEGDGHLCLFGLAVPHEDAGRRAVDAMLDFHSAVRKVGREHHMKIPIEMRSGVHAGIVLLREGDVVRGRYEVLGDPTNIAASLCKKASAGTILASDVALGRDRHFFRTTVPRNLDASKIGLSAPVFEVLGREAVETRYHARSRYGLSPFAGRDDELATLRQWLDADDTPMMLLCGAAGVGKTRLIAEFLACADDRGWHVHQAYCETYLESQPLRPFQQLCTSLVAAEAPKQALLPTASEVAQLVRATAGPVLLVIDDWQWADDASVQLLENLLAAWGPEFVKVRILLASREPAHRLFDRPVRLCLLSALPLADTGQLIATLLPAVDPPTMGWIGAAAGGSPLFIEELCHAWRHGAAGLGSVVERATWIDMLVQARFARLPAFEARLLRLAAVIGSVVPGWLLESLTGPLTENVALRGLAEADFLYPDDAGGTWRFKHGLTREAVYAVIGLGERRQLHRQVAEVLMDIARRDGEAPHREALARHLLAADDPEAALPFAIRAGDAALAVGALDRAQALYGTAIAALQRLAMDEERRVLQRQLVNKYGLACIVDPSTEQIRVLEQMTAAARMSHDHAALTRSLYWHGVITYGLGQARESLRQLKSALQLARAGGEAALATHIEVKLAQSLFAACEYDEGERVLAGLMPTLAVQGLRSSADGEVLAYALCCQGFLFADRGLFAQAADRFAESDRVLLHRTPPMQTSVLAFRAAIALWRGEWTVGGEIAQECLELCRNAGVRYQATMSHALAAYAKWQLRRDQQSVAVLEGAVLWFDTARSRQFSSLLYGWLADVMAERDERARARHFAARAILRIREGGDRLGEAMAWRAVARVDEAAGKSDAADRALARAYRSATLRGSERERAQTSLCEARLLAQRGRVEAGRALAISARDAFATMGMEFFFSQAEAVLAASR